MRKEEEVDVEVRYIKGDPLRELREQGFKVVKPVWPKYLLISPVGDVVFAEIKMGGGRLSKVQLSTLRLLKKLGMTAIVVYKKGSPKKADFEVGKIGDQLQGGESLMEQRKKEHEEMMTELNKGKEGKIKIDD